MGSNQRIVTIYTPNKTYSGRLDIPNDSFRTIDLFNSANIYWKDPAEKSFEDALLLYDASVILEGNTRLCLLSKVQVRLADVLFFCDSLEDSGDRLEKIRAATLKLRSGEDTSTVNIITHTRGDSFFCITGVFYGLFRSKSKQRYIPLTQPSVTAVSRGANGWQKRKVELSSSFVGVSTSHIEACSFKDYTGLGK